MTIQKVNEHQQFSQTTLLQSLYSAFQSMARAVNRLIGKADNYIDANADFGARGDGLTDDTAAIQAAIDAVYMAGGGTVYVPEGKYVISSTLTLPQRVFLVGAGAGFVNPYVNNTNAPRGSVLFLADGSNVDMIQVVSRLTNDGGTLKDTNDNSPNTDARHCGGIENLTLWGNKSTSATISTKDVNTAGCGLRIKGVRNFRAFNVFAMYCADDGFKAESHDYGTGALSCNQIRLMDCTAMNNANDGVNWAGGDSCFYALNCGNNAVDGASFIGSCTVIGGQYWNNGRHGLVHGITSDRASGTITGALSYDNDEAGFYGATAGRAHALVGCAARGNGRDTGATATNRANFVIGSSVKNWHLTGCQSNGTDQGGAVTTQYGFYINNTTYAGTLEGCTDVDSVSAISIADYANLILHGQLNSSSMPHPPMKMTGRIDMNGMALDNPRRLAWERWATISSITSNTITVTTDSLIALNCTGAQTVTDISYSGIGLPLVVFRNASADAVTFTHNTAKIRCAGGVDLVVAQHRAVSFLMIQAGIWQQFGGAV